MPLFSDYSFWITQIRLLNIIGSAALYNRSVNLITLAETGQDVESIEPESAPSTQSVAPVDVQVTTPDGEPGLVREDDKAPVFTAPLQDVEVGYKLILYFLKNRLC